MQHPIGTTQHLHRAIERMHQAQAQVHEEAAGQVAGHSISEEPEFEEEGDG